MENDDFIKLEEAEEVSGNTPEEMLLDEKYRLYAWADVWEMKYEDHTDIHHGPYPLSLRERQNIYYNGSTPTEEHAAVYKNSESDLMAVKVCPNNRVNIAIENVLVSRSDLLKLNPPKKKTSHRKPKYPIYELVDEYFKALHANGERLPSTEETLEGIMQMDKEEERGLNIRHIRGEIHYKDYDDNPQKLTFESFRHGLTRYRERYN